MQNLPNPEDRSDLICYTNRALLCEIRPNMRQVSIEYIKEKKTIIFYVYYDKPLTQEEEDYDVAGTILAGIISDFPQEDLHWEGQIIVSPYPERLPDKGICVFRRYESSPEGDDG